jgi:DNA modification methylase
MVKPAAKMDCQILYGDCREVLKQFSNHFDLIITPPPYAVARKQHYDSIDLMNTLNGLLLFVLSFGKC